MLRERNLKLDLVALGLLAICVFLGASLCSYSPADPPTTLVYPARPVIANVCGRSGAVVSSLLFQGLGIGAYYLVFSLVVVDLLLLGRREVNSPLLRLIGWLISLVGISTLFAMALPRLSPGPIIGSGGFLGAAGRGLLERHFASMGAYIFVLSLIAGGLLLCTDYILIQLLAWGIGTPVRSLGRGALHVGKAYAQRVQRRSDLETAPEELRVRLADEPAVRMKGRPADAAGDAEAPSAEPSVNPPAASAAEPAEENAQEQPAATSESAAADDSSLRIRKPRKSDRDKVIDQIEAASKSNKTVDYELPSLDLLLPSESFSFDEHEADVRRKAKILEKTFADFGFNVRVVEIQTGPVIAQFEVELEAGLRLSRITGLAEDLAIALRVPSVRIVAPIPGKNTVGIEVPNAQRHLVRMREVMEEASSKATSKPIPIYLGKDVAGNPMVCDLASLPHLLIAGRTGTGKSVCLNSIIISLLMTRRPDEVRMLMIDPKMVELSQYKNIPHLMHPVVTDMRKAEAILGWAVEKMEERYQLLARAGVRSIGVYNQLGEEELMDRVCPVDDDERKLIPTHMPYIVIVADEMADLMMTAAKEVETHIIRLAQKSRAVGIHLVLATQKPTVDVITGLIKSNLPARIAFQVASRTDSRVVLDEMGADKLLGNGDMLFLWPGTSTLIRGQGTYLSDDEINRVIDAVATSEPEFVKELVQLKASDPKAEAGKPVENRDDLYDAAVDLVVREGRGSCSLLQRALGIGYGRAARLIDFMAEDGLVGAYNGSQAREVLISIEDWEQRRGNQNGFQAAPTPPRNAANKILLAPSRSEDEDIQSAAPPRESCPAKPKPTPVRQEKPSEDEKLWDQDGSSDEVEDAEIDEDEEVEIEEADEAESNEASEEEDSPWDEEEDEASDDGEDDQRKATPQKPRPSRPWKAESA